MALTKVTMGLINGLAAKVLDIMKDHSNINLGEAKAATGTFVDFMIPEGVKRITVMFDGVSTNGTSPFIIQVGNITPITAGYTGASVSSGGVIQNTIGMILNRLVVTTEVYQGVATLTVHPNQVDSDSRLIRAGSSTNDFFLGFGHITVSGLDRLRITTANGTDQFDNGQINVSWEF